SARPPRSPVTSLLPQPHGFEGCRVGSIEAHADDRSVTHGHRVPAWLRKVDATSRTQSVKVGEDADLVLRLDEPQFVVDEWKRPHDPFPILKHGCAAVDDLLIDEDGAIPFHV